MLGDKGNLWQDTFAESSPGLHEARKMQGTLQAIREAVESNLLITVEGLIMSEAFSDLLDQADYLIASGFFLAAGVLGRAVLEERLRKWCQHISCVPPKPTPTMSDFYTELQKVGKLNALERKHIESMTGVGSDCAHNKGAATKADVERMLRDIREFLIRHPIA
jgi:hypothetical protein